MKRREFIALLGAALGVWPVAARGQQSIAALAEKAHAPRTAKAARHRHAD